MMAKELLELQLLHTNKWVDRACPGWEMASGITDICPLFVSMSQEEA